MSTFAFLIVCIQACLIFNVFNSCFGAVIAPSPYAFGAGCAASGAYGFAEFAGPYSYGCGSKFAAPYAYGTEYIAPCGLGSKFASPYVYGPEYVAPCGLGKGLIAPIAGPYVL